MSESPNQPSQTDSSAQSGQSQTPQPEDAIKQLSFEQAVERLEQIIERIETGEIGIEDTLKHYESGIGLIAHSRSILDRAESRIAELTRNDDGSLSITEPPANESPST